MDTPQTSLIESVLSLPQDLRASLAFRLLQSLDPPGVGISAEEFGSELRDRVEGYRRGLVGSSSLEEVRSIMRERLSKGSSS